MGRNTLTRKLLRHIPVLSGVVKTLDMLEHQNQELRERLALHMQGHLRDHPQTSLPDLSGIDGLPLPPPVLRHWVAGTDDVDWFVESGKLGAQTITEILAKHHIALDQLESVLDFGCGCGRVIRHLWPYESVRLYGTDYNKAAIAWCDENLNFAVFSTDPLEPPTRYRDHSFDLVYAFSVLTHLTEELQASWMQELHRILKPNGYLIISVHGDHMVSHLPKAELARYRQGEVVVLGTDDVGQNDCVAFHPESYVRNTLAKGFDVMDFVPQGAAGNPLQDAYLLRSRER